MSSSSASRRVSVVTMSDGSRSCKVDADVNRLIVVEQSDFGVLGARQPFERLGLDEAAERRGVLPHALVEHAVDGRRFGDLNGRGNRRDCRNGSG